MSPKQTEGFGVPKGVCKRIFVVLLGICILLSGCAQNPKNAPDRPGQTGAKGTGQKAGYPGNGQEAIKGVDAELFEITNTELIYLGDQDGRRLLLSPNEDNRCTGWRTRPTY